MRVPLIKIQDIEKKKSFILTDTTPIFHIYEQNGCLSMFDMIYKEDSPYRFNEGSLQFVDVRKILELYIEEEISWLKSKELEKEAEKLLSVYDKINSKVSSTIFDKNQQSIEEYFERVGMEIEYTDDDSWKKENITDDEWNKLTSCAYYIAKTLVSEGKNITSVATYVIGQPYEEIMKELAIVYYKYATKCYTKEIAKIKIAIIKKEIK